MANEQQTYIGIDYGMGTSNRNATTGIHYGVISLNSLASWIYDDVESDYGKPHCPDCGNEIKASADPTLFEGSDIEIDDIVMREGIQASPDGTPAWFDQKDYTCLDCKTCYWSDSCFPDESVSRDFMPNSAEYKTEYSESLNALFVCESPYYTYARYCSPCCPGALDLDSPVTYETGIPHGSPQAYCFSHDYFEDGKVPYRVFRVADDTEVLTDGKGTV